MTVTDRVADLERRVAEASARQEAERRAQVAELTMKLAEAEAKTATRGSEAEAKLALRVVEAEKKAVERTSDLIREQRIVVVGVISIFVSIGGFNLSKLTGLETKVASQEKLQVTLDARVAGMLQTLGELPSMKAEVARIRGEIDALPPVTAPPAGSQASGAANVAPVKNAP